MIILYNGKFLTLNSHQPQATAVAIQAGKITAVGSDVEILALAERGSRQVNLAGKTVWPGLTDAHIHLDHYSRGLKYIDCETSTRQECLDLVLQKAALTPSNEWIRGHGWNQNNWPEGFGSAADLDAVAPHHPVYLTAKSLHASWANSAALKLAGLADNTPDPEGGKLLRDSSGRLTGILLESAMELVEKKIPAPTVGQVRQNLRTAQQKLWGMGLTGVHDFDHKSCFSALQEMDREQELHLRVVKSIPYEDLPSAAGVGLRSGWGSSYLRIGSVKMFADGALGPQTASMVQPYEGSPANSGYLLLDAEHILEAGQQAALSGLSMAIHAIGDRANHEVLNAYAQLRQYETDHQFPHLRHRIEHVQILHPDDFTRLAKLNVIASVQPIHAPSDMFMADRYWGRRSQYAYAYKTLLDAGTVLAFGSDAPVESPNPFFGLYAATARRRSDGQPGSQGWYPNQRLQLMEALYGFTLGAAFAAGLENRLGQLAEGCFADLIILPIDPFSLEPEALLSIQPTATMVGGNWVYGGVD